MGSLAEQHFAVRRFSVIQRANADWVARGDQGITLCIIENQRKFRVQRAEHIQIVFFEQRKQNFAVRFAGEFVFVRKRIAHLPEAVQLAVADNVIAVHFKRLHTAFIQSHDRQPMKAQIAGLRFDKR